MDQAHAAQADRSAAALMLASSIADAYFGWQSDQNRLLLAREKELAVELQAKVSGARVRADLDSADELNSADLAVAAAREQIAMLEGSAKLRVVELAALVGRPISELPPLSPKPLPSFPGALPDNVKIDLISRRADITASRWRVEAAERSLASARADFFPDVSVNALLGVSSIDVGKLLEYGSRVPQVSARHSSADIRCGQAQGTLRRRAGRDRLGGLQLSGHGHRRRARRGHASHDPRPDRSPAHAAREASRRGVAHEKGRRCPRASGLERLAQRIDGDRILDRPARRPAAARFRGALGRHRAAARAGRRLRESAKNSRVPLQQQRHHERKHRPIGNESSQRQAAQDSAAHRGDLHRHRCVVGGVLGIGAGKARKNRRRLRQRQPGGDFGAGFRHRRCGIGGRHAAGQRRTSIGEARSHRCANRLEPRGQRLRLSGAPSSSAKSHGGSIRFGNRNAQAGTLARAN